MLVGLTAVAGGDDGGGAGSAAPVSDDDDDDGVDDEVDGNGRGVNSSSNENNGGGGGSPARGGLFGGGMRRGGSSFLLAGEADGAAEERHSVARMRAASRLVASDSVASFSPCTSPQRSPQAASLSSLGRNFSHNSLFFEGGGGLHSNYSFGSRSPAAAAEAGGSGIGDSAGMGGGGAASSGRGVPWSGGMERSSVSPSSAAGSPSPSRYHGGDCASPSSSPL